MDPTDATIMPIVSVVIPVRNEASYLRGAIEAFQSQRYPHDRLEIIAVDGGSTDGTIEAMALEAQLDPRVRLLGGPGVNTPTAMNVGIAAASGSLVAASGGHGKTDPQFLGLAVGHLQADSTLGAVGGLIVPAGEGPKARANMIARFSVFGVGRGVYTTSHRLQYVDTVQWGVYRKEVLEKAGLYDPDLQFGEDEELNYRIRQVGFRILFDPAMRITYFARSTFKGLFRQYRNYGRARVRVLRKHPSFFRLKHVVPSAVVVALIASLVVAPFLWQITVVTYAIYALFIVAASLVLAYRERFPYPHYVAISLMSLHIGYGLGMLLGIADLIGRR